MEEGRCHSHAETVMLVKGGGSREDEGVVVGTTTTRSGRLIRIIRPSY